MAKRTALSLLAALLAAGMLCACAAQPASTAEEAAQPAQTEQQAQSQPAEAEALAEEEQAQEALAEEEPEEQPVPRPPKSRPRRMKTVCGALRRRADWQCCASSRRKSTA